MIGIERRAGFLKKARIAGVLAAFWLATPAIAKAPAPPPNTAKPAKEAPAPLPERVTRHRVVAPASVIPGTVAERTFHYLLWRPPIALKSSERYPLIVMLHGLGGDPESFVELGKMHERLDDAVRKGKLRPCLAVMVEGRNGYWADWTDGKHHFAKLVTDVYMPAIQRAHPVIGKPQTTAIVGPSMGGFGALSIGLKRPDLFGTIVAMSPTDMQYAAEDSPRRKFYTDVFGAPIHMPAVKRANPHHLVLAGHGKGQRIFVSWGGAEGRKFKDGSERLVATMRNSGLKVQHQQVPGGKHGWASTWVKSHPWWIAGLGKVWGRRR